MFLLISLGASLSLILLVSAGSVETSLPDSTSSGVTVQVAVNQPSHKPVVKSKLKRKKSQVAPVSPQTAALQPAIPQRKIAAVVDSAWTKANFSSLQFPITRLVVEAIPQAEKNWAARTFVLASAPVFDGCVLILAIFVSLVGLVRGLITRNEIELKIAFCRTELITLLG